MSNRTRVIKALAVTAILLAPAAARAHEAVKAVIVMKPGQPHAGETCTVAISVLAPPGMPVLDQIQGVRIVGEMEGHNMTPLEAPLTAAADPGAYQGTFALTMGGPWKLTLRIKVANEEMWSSFPVQAVRANEAGDPVGMRYVVEMHDPVRSNLFSPWMVVGVTLGLIALVEIAAIVLNGRSLRRAPAAA